LFEGKAELLNIENAKLLDLEEKTEEGISGDRKNDRTGFAEEYYEDEELDEDDNIKVNAALGITN
jgi:hypothetical protein